jgi:putative ABC transport system substrate-binding protein
MVMRRRDLAVVFAIGFGFGARIAAAAPPVSIVGLSPDPTEFIPEYLGGPLHDTLQSIGWQEGRDYTFRARSTGGEIEGLPAAARELVAYTPQVILGFGEQAIRAAQQATKTIPIVGLADDMVGSGLVASMAHPGGNTTGISILAGELDAKRLQLLHELVPPPVKMAALADPATASTRSQVEDTARRLGRDLVFVTAANHDDALAAIRRMVAEGVGALNICSSPVLYAARAEIFDLVAALRLPTIYLAPEAAQEGGLVAYGAPLSTCYRQLVALAIKILKGAKPADLPVEQPTKFELIVNLKTAKALGLTMPPIPLAQADEVIE